MKSIFAWEWKKLYIPSSVSNKRNSVTMVLKVAPTYPDKWPDFAKYRRHDIVLVSGDGNCLAQDVAEFDSWAIAHDIYAVNRSLIFHEKQVDHWAAVDIEECAWFTQNLNSKVESIKPVLRHSIGEEIKYGKEKEGTGLFDVYWEMKCKFENDYQRRVFVGNSGYFAVLTAIYMGYKKIILAGMPLNSQPHFYESDSEDGPKWNGMTYMQWMDAKMQLPEFENVRSLSGYSAFILGKATKEWLLS